MSFTSRHPGRCSACRLPYDAGERITCTTEAWEVPPQFRHDPTCPTIPEVVSAADHVPVEIGGYDEDGRRTFAPIGQVCAGCSDSVAGRWVPVSDCPTAWAALVAQDHATDILRREAGWQ